MSFGFRIRTGVETLQDAITGRKKYRSIVHLSQILPMGALLGEPPGNRFEGKWLDSEKDAEEHARSVAAEIRAKLEANRSERVQLRDFAKERERRGN